MNLEYIGTIVFDAIICLVGAIAGIRKMKRNDEINRLVDERNQRRPPDFR